MDTIKREKLEAAIRFRRTQAVKRAVAALLHALAAAALVFCTQHLLPLWNDIIVTCHTSKETVFLLCNIILMLLLAASGAAGRLDHPAVHEKTNGGGAWGRDCGIGFSSNCTAAASELQGREGEESKQAETGEEEEEEELAVESGEEEKAEEELAVEPGEEEKAGDWGVSDEELDRKFEEFISNYKKGLRTEAGMALEIN